MGGGRTGTNVAGHFEGFRPRYKFVALLGLVSEIMTPGFSGGMIISIYFNPRIPVMDLNGINLSSINKELINPGSYDFVGSKNCYLIN